MEWFRWYHGTVSDPKFSIIAKRSKQPRSLVIAFWSLLLEFASTRDERGSAWNMDLEEAACVLDVETEQIEAIYQAMKDKLLIDGNMRIAKWEKRQPKREDETAKERMNRWRERNKEQNKAPVTQSYAPVTHATDKNRTEKNREEQITSTTPLPPSSDKGDPPPPPPEQKAKKMTINDFRFVHQDKFGTNMPPGCNSIAEELCRDNTREAIIQAFEVAAVQGKTNVAYVRGVLNGNQNQKRRKPAKDSEFAKAMAAELAKGGTA